MKTSYVLMYTRNDGKIARFTVGGGDPDLPEAAVKAVVGQVRDANVLSEKFGVLTGLYGYQRINVETSEYSLA